MTDERTLTCQELTEVLTDYLEGVMSPEDVVRFEAHLDALRRLRHLRRPDAQDHPHRPRAAPGHVEATAPDDLLAAFRAWKRGEPLPGT